MEGVLVAERKPSHISVDEYLALERASKDRHEYIDGHMYLMAGGTTNHGLLSTGFIGTLRDALRGTECRVYPSDVRVIISSTRYVYPDVSVSCDDRDAGDREEIMFPKVIVEVLSRSTEAYDRGDKFGHYQACPSIEEYVLVHARRAQIEVYRRGIGEWTLRAFGANSQVKLSSLGVHVSVAEIYRGVEFFSDAADEHIAE